MSMTLCSECLARVSTQATFCPHCGATRQPEPTPRENRQTLDDLRQIVGGIEEAQRQQMGEEAWAARMQQENRRKARNKEKTKQTQSEAMLIFAAVIAGILFLCWLMSN